MSSLMRRLIALLLFLSPGVQAQEVPNYRDRYQLGLVHLTVNGVDPATGRSVEERKGSAFFIADDRRMLSSRHLFVGQDGRRLNQMTIVGRLGSHRGRPFDIVANASLPRLHAEFDVAMLTTDDPTLGQRALPLCFDRPPQVGHRVVALGFPRGEDYDQTDGTIRSTSPAFAEAWLTNADLNPGNSGGPVLSLGGSVVAIVIGGFREGGIQGQNAVLPLRVAQQFIEQVVSVEQRCEATPLLESQYKPIALEVVSLSQRRSTEFRFVTRFARTEFKRVLSSISALRVDLQRLRTPFSNASPPGSAVQAYRDMLRFLDQIQKTMEQAHPYTLQNERLDGTGPQQLNLALRELELDRRGFCSALMRFAAETGVVLGGLCPD